ncbi:uncharacterized protein [Montipora capricornis]|uniref:uncharacterized protein n=1 Tax=Montipora capricornis TaxID=246305 RepID=UPI0035F12387
MAKFVGLFFALVLSKHLLFQVTGRFSCSSSGISGCECLFLGACDADGKQKDKLKINKHVPLGLEVLGNTLYGRQNLAYLCEGRTVGILYDCNYRIPLFAATVIRGSQLSKAPGNRPSKKFILSESGLDKHFQQSNEDYEKPLQRKICYKRRSGNEMVDVDWYRAKNLKRPRYKVCTGAGSADVETRMHRGHLIASQYGVGDQRLKKLTFVYTNAVPQFADFNSGPWQIAESALVDWCRDNCAKKGQKNVQIFIVVGAIPSTMLDPSKTRYFGKNGFSDFQDDTNYRVNVPAEMWTAACCTFEFTKDREKTWQRGVRSTAFWRKNVPGTLPVNRVDVQWLESMLKTKRRKVSEIYLFPYTKECRNSTNFIALP